MLKNATEVYQSNYTIALHTSINFSGDIIFLFLISFIHSSKIKIHFLATAATKSVSRN